MVGSDAEVWVRIKLGPGTHTRGTFLCNLRRVLFLKHTTMFELRWQPAFTLACHSGMDFFARALGEAMQHARLCRMGDVIGQWLASAACGRSEDNWHVSHPLDAEKPESKRCRMLLPSALGG